MILAVVEARAEIGDRKSGQKAALGGIAQALLDRGNPVLGNGPAENIIDELDALASRQRLQADAAKAELPVPAGLLLVFAFGVGLAADGLAVGNLGRLQSQLHVVAFAKLGHHDFDVLLARAGKQEFLGLRIAAEAQREVLFQYFVDGRADAVFVRSRFGLDGKGYGGLGNARRRIVDGRVLVAERVRR